MSRNALMFRNFDLNVSQLGAVATKYFRLCRCAALLLAAGCVHRATGIHNTVVINRPFETTWPSVVKAARQMNPNAAADMTTGTISTEEFLTAESFHVEDYARPPRRLFPSWKDTRFSATFTGRENKAGQTEVTVQCYFYRFNSNGDVWEVWHSLGKIEPLLLAQIQEQNGLSADQGRSAIEPRSADASPLLNQRR